MAWTVYSTRILDTRITSDATYRVLGKWISDQLESLGWAKTADTGQVDWATTTRPGAPTANTKGGYEIRKSTKASADIYLKITYGLGYNTNCLSMWIATGEGSDGAGALTGDQATESACGGAVGANTPYESTFIVAGDAYNFVVGLSDVTPANGLTFGVQRTCDASGVDTATGWYMYTGGMNNSAALASNCQYVGFVAGAANKDTSPAWGILNIPRAFVTTSAVPCLPFYVQNGLTYAPLRDVCCLYYGTILGEFDVPLYGATRRYKQMVVSTTVALWGVTPAVASGFGIRIA